MQSRTYKDIIDGKITEWHQGLKKLEKRMEKSAADSTSPLSAKVEQIKLKIEAATVELHNLDERETIENTMKTKSKILKIFSNIDEEFSDFQQKTPFML